MGDFAGWVIKIYITLHALGCFRFDSFEFSKWNWNGGLSKVHKKVNSNADVL